MSLPSSSTMNPINNPEVTPSESLFWNHAFDLALVEYPLEPTLASLIVSEYEGEKDEHNRMSGSGFAAFANGDKYEGMFLKGMMHGEGLYTWSDGTIYSGSFLYNEIIGKGKYTWPDGSIYEGEVYKGKRNGKGTFSFPAAFPRYTGDWTNGKRNGFGRLDYIMPPSAVAPPTEKTKTSFKNVMKKSKAVSSLMSMGGKKKIMMM